MNKKGIGQIVNAVGVMLLLALIAVLLPLSVPKLFGMRLYGVASGSMEPEYGTGGVVYVAQCDTAALAVGDVITFRLGTDTDYVMTHRIASIDDEGYFVTKGDANDTEDPEPVAPERVIGRVVGYLPYLANAAELMGTATGAALLLTVFIVALICFLGGDLLKKSAPTESSDTPRRLVRIVAVLMIVGAAAYLGYVLLQYRAGEQTYDALEEELYALADEGTDGSEDTSGSLGEATEQMRRVCNAVAALQEKYTDMIGWIAFENPDIQYPIMYSGENEYYLKHTYSGETNSAGSIFADALNHTDFSDSHTIIYGHNMRNLTMFGSLRSYKDPDFYEGNETFMIYTADAAYRYEIFAYYDVTDTSDIYTIWYMPDEAWAERVQRMMEDSAYDTGVTADTEDTIVTLSTCSTEGHRFVIHAKRVETVEF